MKNTTAAARTGIASVLAFGLALALALTGCAADQGPTDKVEQSATSPVEVTAAPSQAGSPEPPSAPQPGGGQTLDSYLKENNIDKTAVHRGDPGPVIDLPTPEGWTRVGESADAPYAGLVQSKPVNPSDPPRIKAALFKLTGHADPARILQLAPADLQNIPGFRLMGDFYDGTLAGFKSKQAGGGYTKDGNTRLIAQKTVVIPGGDALFVLQLTADGLESDIGPMMQATSDIDKETKITP
jgi:hypothetical protein